MKVNLNQKVSFKLTSYGAKILDKHKEKLFDIMPDVGMEAINDYTCPINKDGYRESQLWQLMQIFGDKMFIGDDTPFKNNEIIIEVKA
jgi:hypothetical protein